MIDSIKHLYEFGSLLCAQEETTLVMIFDVMMIAMRALMAFYCH